MNTTFNKDFFSEKLKEMKGSSKHVMWVLIILLVIIIILIGIDIHTYAAYTLPDLKKQPGYESVTWSSGKAVSIIAIILAIIALIFVIWASHTHCTEIDRLLRNRSV